MQPQGTSGQKGNKGRINDSPIVGQQGGGQGKGGETKKRNLASES
jgi:hypothetical protein